MLLYDPRVRHLVETDNPALILAEKMSKSKLVNSNDPGFWKMIKKLADYADMKIKRKIWFEPKYRKVKRHKLTFYCSKYNWILSGCNMSCEPCLALKYNKEVRWTLNLLSG